MCKNDGKYVEVSKMSYVQNQSGFVKTSLFFTGVHHPFSTHNVQNQPRGQNPANQNHEMSWNLLGVQTRHNTLYTCKTGFKTNLEPWNRPTCARSSLLLRMALSSTSAHPQHLTSSSSLFSLYSTSFYALRLSLPLPLLFFDAFAL